MNWRDRQGQVLKVFTSHAKEFELYFTQNRKALEGFKGDRDLI